MVAYPYPFGSGTRLDPLFPTQLQADLDAITTAINAVTTTATTGLGTALSFLIDGGGSTITTGVKGYVSFPFQCTINSATLLSDQGGSIVVNIWKCTFAQFDSGATHPVAADKITASAPPTISVANKATDSTLTGWTKTINSGDILAFNVDSVTACAKVTLTLGLTKF